MENFNFGTKPSMKEVPAGTEAIFSFNGEPVMVETEYGEKYSFPITLISHDSYPLLEDGPIKMTWQSKCAAAKQLYNDYWLATSDLTNEDAAYQKKLKKAYNEKKWQLTRFDTGAYWLDLA
tara:strand:+ start:948 stop:1310 length:363 start_codon:yes stop_codon:yes gene_type:complete